MCAESGVPSADGGHIAPVFTNAAAKRRKRTKEGGGGVEHAQVAVVLWGKPDKRVGNGVGDAVTYRTAISGVA